MTYPELIEEIVRKHLPDTFPRRWRKSLSISLNVLVRDWMCDTRTNVTELERLVDGNQAEDAAEEQDLIDLVAATLIEFDQPQFEEAFELLVRCHTRDLHKAHPAAPPEEIIGCVQKFIENVTRRVEEIKASGGTVTGTARSGPHPTSVWLPEQSSSTRSGGLAKEALCAVGGACWRTSSGASNTPVSYRPLNSRSHYQRIIPMKHSVRPISTEATARASWVLVQQIVAQAIASGDLDKASAVEAVSAAIDTMPDPPARASQDAVKMLKAFRAFIELESPRPD
jgi:hypothetical protein